VKIVLFSGERIVEFLLPSQVFGTFVFDEFEDEENKLINVEAQNNNWFLTSTTAVRVYNNNDYSYNVKLELNNFYVLERENKKYLIYTDNIFDNTFTKFKFNNKINLLVGKEKKCNVYYDSEYVNGVLFSIKYEGGSLILEKKDNQAIYINKNILYTNVNKYIVKSGDIIECFGLKVVILQDIILINNPSGKVFFNNITSNIEELVINYDTNLINAEIKEHNLYNENDYFSKSPRLRRTIQNKEIKIDGPPSINENEEVPLMFTLGPMLTMGMVSGVNMLNTLIKINNGETTFTKSWTTLVTGSAMLCTTLLWPTLTKMFNKAQKKRKRKENIKKYRQYLEEKKKEIIEEANLQSEILIENLIPISETYDMILNKKVGLWGRRVEQEDFLKVRIGVGDYPLDVTINCPEEAFSIEDITLRKEAQELAKEYELLKNVPIGYSFLERMITAVLGSSMKIGKLMENIILQLVAFHSYEDLKIVIFTNKNNENRWEFVKYLPHNFDNNKQIRFFATNIEEAKEVSNYLEQEINNRRYDEEMREVERNYTQCRPYYLIITDNYSKVKRTGVMKALTEVNNNYGFSLVILENRLSKLPSKCNNFISIGEKSSSILEDAYENQRIINFNDEIEYDVDMKLVANKLSNIPIEFEHGTKMLPDSVTFLEMENVGKVEQLNIINRWKNNDPTKSLKAEIGVGENGDLMYLDLHEKYHGPHGLIAGMTGSGKSEFIITYVLSMAINYSPEEVAFILIDYKGGGLAGAFENKATGIKLPHLAGTITNLDKAEMDRTLVSIDSEVRRRQRVFNEARDKLGESTIDIYKYQRFYRDGKLEEAVPHLIIVCDEFAELKSQQPEFMDNLISIARIGRSLGVHLILATQKPSGVVNDQIWSNSKFRVCLKVQEKADSMEMLKRSEAAELKQVGRFYLQVGYNELFALGQSAWCGAKYFPSDKVKKNIDRALNFINNFGYIIKSIQGASGNKGPAMGEELANILKYIIEAAKLEGVFARRLWLDNVPDVVLVDNLLQKYKIGFNKNVIEAVIGEYDDPNNQSQGLLKVNLNNDGNIIVYGAQGNDKELLLDSIIYSTATRHGSDEINYYFIDYGSESLRKFRNFPHVGDMVFAGEDEKLNNLFKLLKGIINDRKKLFSSYGGEYNNYIRNSGASLPLIGVVVNNYDSFMETNFNTLEEDFIKLTRDGLRYGVFFVITANSEGSIRRKIKQNFNTLLALRLNDISDYTSIFGRVNSVPKDVIGRGLFKVDSVYEFQTSHITDVEDSNEYISNIGTKLCEINKVVAERIPTLPKTITLDYVHRYLDGIASVPIGISKSTLEIVNYDFTNYLSTFILSTNSLNTASFSRTLLLELAKIKDIQLIVVDINKEVPEVRNSISYYYDNEPKKVLEMLTDYVKRLKETMNNGVRTVIYFQNFNKFKTRLESIKLEEFTRELKNSENINLIIADDYKKFKKLEFDTWYRNIQNDTDGIWLGTGLSDQNLFKISKITKEMSFTYRNNFGFVIRDGRAELFKTIELEEYKVGDADDE